MATIQQLLAILPNNRQTAIHARDIARQLGLPIGGNEVETRQLIRDAIRQGHFIVSSTRVGYWLSSNKNEVQRYISSLQNRADDTQQRANELRQAWNAINPNNVI